MISAKQVKELRDLTGAGMLDCKKALEASDGNIEGAIDWLREKGISKAAGKQERIAAEGLSTAVVDAKKAVILEVNTETDFVAKNPEFQILVNDIAQTMLASDAKTIEEANNLMINGVTVSDTLIAKTAKIGEKLSFRRVQVLEANDEEIIANYIHMGGKISVLIKAKGTNVEAAKDIAMHAAAMRPKYVSQNEIPADVVEHEKKVLTEQAMNEGKPEAIANKMVEGRIKKYFSEICLLDQAFVKDGDITVAQFALNSGIEVLSMVRFEVGEGLEKRQENFAEEVMAQVRC